MIQTLGPLIFSHLLAVVVLLGAMLGQKGLEEEMVAATENGLGTVLICSCCQSLLDHSELG